MELMPLNACKMAIKNWIIASRPRTLPLSLACIGMGTFLAASYGYFDGLIFSFCILTTILLQVLSNLSNDYGDSIHGADSIDRKGPSRSVQSGAISVSAMRNGIKVMAVLALISGLTLIWLAFQDNLRLLITFLVIGVLAIIAAVTYTAGKKPYGYAGLGDISVLLFFGLIGVVGTYFLYTKSLNWPIFLPALSCGLFSVAVLNVNNIRDIESDRLAGKKSIPVRIGRQKAVFYHWLLLLMGFISALLFVAVNYQSMTQLLFLLSLPLILINGKAVSSKKEASELDPYLKQMAITTLIFVLTFGIGLLIGQ